MKQLLSIFLLLVACSNPTEISNDVDLGINDFIPPSEPERGYEEAGPFEHRLLTATSKDGLTWEKQNQIITEQGNTPDTVVRNGTIYLYYTGGNFDGQEQGIAAALSSDGGETWIFKRVTLNGLDDIQSIPGDPDIALLEDGTFRLYFTAQADGDPSPAIFLAESTNGLDFDYVGKTFDAEGYITIDSSAFYVNGEWMMLTFNGFGSEVIHARSQDEGLHFTFEKAQNITAGKDPVFMANPITLEDGSVRFYAFDLAAGLFYSFTSSDGLNWSQEPGVRLSYDDSNELEGFYIKDPSVVRLDDGTYLMIYVTRAPLEE